MSQTTYRKFAQEILDAHYGGINHQDAALSQRFIAEWVAEKVAKEAVRSAIGNSNLTECTYSNDQFISVFYNCPLLTNANTGEKYAVMPATPAGLPKGREIAQVSFVGANTLFVVPMQNKDSFIETNLPPLPNNMILFKVEDGNIVFPNLPAIITANVNMKLVGAVPPGTTILDSNLNIPKDVEDSIRTEILGQLAVNYKIPIEKVNEGEPV